MIPVMFPEDKPKLTKDGLIPPKGRYITIDEAGDYGLTLSDWAVLYWCNVQILDRKHVDKYQNFFCGSRPSYFRLKRSLKERGLL